MGASDRVNGRLWLNGVGQIFYKFGVGFNWGIRRHVFDNSNTFARNGNCQGNMIGDGQDVYDYQHCIPLGSL